MSTLGISTFCILFHKILRLNVPLFPSFGQSDTNYLPSSGGEQGPGTFRQGGARGDDVVCQKNPLVPQAFRAEGPVSAQHIGPTVCLVGQGGLGAGVPCLLQKGEGCAAQGVDHGSGKQLGLVISPLSPPCPGEWYPCHQVVPPGQMVLDALGHQCAPWSGVAGQTAEFIAVDGLAHLALVAQGRDAEGEKLPCSLGLSAQKPWQLSLTARAEQFPSGA